MNAYFCFPLLPFIDSFVPEAQQAMMASFDDKPYEFIFKDLIQSGNFIHKS